MTRDEAIEIMRQRIVIVDRGEATKEELRNEAAKQSVDAFEKLGMLKLDEPKSINERAIDALFAGSKSGVITPRHALDALSAANLKITEK